MPPISSSSARTGVLPMPPAISATLSRRRTAAVKTPNGPSAATRVPGLISSAMRLEKSPSRLTVTRSERPSGVAAGENRCDSNQWRRVRKRQRKNCPACPFRRSSRRPPIVSETTPGASSTTAVTRSPLPSVCSSGTSMWKTTSSASVAMYCETQESLATCSPASPVPVGTWWSQASAIDASP